MAVRDDFAAGEVLSAADLNDTFASKLPYSYGTATPSTSDSGFLWYDSNSTPPDVKFWDGSAFQALGGGKILQVVRATDSTDRSTTSTTLVDASLSVTITPTKTTSAILLVTTNRVVLQSGSTNIGTVAITDSSDNIVAGQSSIIGLNSSVSSRYQVVMLAYDTPATTSATTYKQRFSAGTGVSITMFNSNPTGQMYALEIGA